METGASVTRAFGLSRLRVCLLWEKQRAQGRLRDFIYHRRSGTDGSRLGGERICENPQIQGEFIEAAVLAEVCRLLKNRQRLEQEHHQRAGRSSEDAEILKSQLGKLQRGVERLIDSYSEGVIDKGPVHVSF